LIFRLLQKKDFEKDNILKQIDRRWVHVTGSVIDSPPLKRFGLAKKKYTPVFTSKFFDDMERETRFYDLPKGKKKTRLNVTKFSTHYTT